MLTSWLITVQPHSDFCIEEGAVSQEAERNERGLCHNGAILNHAPLSLGIGMNNNLDRSSDPLRKGSERFFDLPERKGVSRERL